MLQGDHRTLTETKPHIKTKAAFIIDFHLVITVGPDGKVIVGPSNYI